MLRSDSDAYEELAQLQVMERASITHPSYAEGKIYVRSHTHLAAVAITDGSTPTLAADLEVEWKAPSPVLPGDSKFGKFLETLVTADDAGATVENFLSTRQFPLVEGDLVHFVYHGEAHDLALYLGYTWRRDPDLFLRVPGTDFWHLSYRLEPGGRYNYQLQRNFDEIIVDPLNPQRSPGPGAISQLAMPEWSPAAYLSEPQSGAHGSIDSLTFASELLGNERRIDVYLPAGYAASTRDYPLLLVCDDADARKLGLMQNTLDHLVGESVAPCVVAFEHYPPGRRWTESFLAQREEHAQMLAEELIPFLRDRYRVSKQRKDTVTMGTFTGAHAALYTALKYPDRIGGVATQSLAANETASLFALQRAGAAKLRLYMDWCNVEWWDPGESLDVREINIRLARWLADAGHAVTAREHRSGTGWGTWRNHTGDLLSTVFPLQ